MALTTKHSGFKSCNRKLSLPLPSFSSSRDWTLTTWCLKTWKSTSPTFMWSSEPKIERKASTVLASETATAYVYTPKHYEGCYVETSEVKDVMRVMTWNITSWEPLTQVPKSQFQEAPTKIKKLDFCVIQEIRAGPITISGYKTMIFPFSTC